jgi:alpha-L-rhamnosidase
MHFRHLTLFALLIRLPFVCIAQAPVFTGNPILLTQYWDARWIVCPGASPNGFGVYHFRKQIDIVTVPARYLVHLSGDHRYRLFVNGRSVCTGPARSDTQHWNFESVDLAPWLRTGANTLAVVVWNGGPNAPFAQMSYRTGFVMQGNTEAEKAVNTADGTWKCWINNAYQPEPVDIQKMQTYIVVGDGERVDGRQYPWGWEQPGYDDSAWPAAKALWFAAKTRGLGTDGNWMLVPRTIPQLEETPQRFRAVRRSTNIALSEAFVQGGGAVTIAANSRATLLLDQGWLTTAYPVLTLSSGNSAKITLTYAEALVDDKRNKGNRNEVDGKQIFGNQDVFVADGGTKRVFSTLWFRTFRYVQVDVETDNFPLIIHDISSVFTGYPLVEKAAFSSSQSNLKSIWDTGWRTARMCAGETYYDCPYYEQLQYTGDTRVQSFISLYVSGDDRLMRKALTDYDNSRIQDGLTQSRYPCNDLQVIPTFSLFWVSMVHDYWMHRLDDAFIRTFFKGIDDVLAWHEARMAPNGLNGPMEWWHFTDWCWPWNEAERNGGVPPGARYGGSSILSMQQAYTLRQAAELFAAFGQSEKADRYAKRAKAMTEAAYRLCWDNQRRAMADTPQKNSFSQHASIWAILTDAVPAAEQAPLLRRLVQDSSMTQATFYFKFYLFEALKKTKTGDLFLPLLQPWHDMCNIGLSTFAENPEPTRSDCHAWSVYAPLHPASEQC